MSNIETLMLASTLDRFKQGEEFQRLPLHVPIAPWFRLDADQYNDFDQELQGILKHIAASDFSLYTAVNSLVERMHVQLPRTGSVPVIGLDWSMSGGSTPDLASTEPLVVSYGNLTVFEDHGPRDKRIRAVHRWGSHD